MSQTINTISELQTVYNVNPAVISYIKSIHKQAGVDEDYLTELQKTVFSNGDFWDDSKNVIVQGRTSSGKTLVAQMATAYFGSHETIASEKPRNKVVYLVPLRAMVSEKRDEFKQIFSATLGWQVYASSSDYQDHDDNILEANFDVAIIVYEKFFALLAQDDNDSFVKSCGLIVIDELQMMNDEGRGPKLEISLTKIKNLNPYCKIMGLSTTQCNIRFIETWLEATTILSYHRPKALEEYVVWPDSVNSCFRYYLHEEPEDGAKIGDDSHSEDGEKLGTQVVSISERDKNAEEKMIPSMISHVLEENRNSKILVFINSKNNTRILANIICDHLAVSGLAERKLIDDTDERILNFKFSDDESAIDMISDLLPLGVAFHHGGLSRALRDFVEDEFRSKEGLINIIVATETLAIGVNMPADVVILAGVKLPRSHSFKNEMRSHEYKNYVGRAGRLGESSATKGKSYLLASSKAKANDYWGRYITAMPVTISSALKRLNELQQVPYFFNLMGDSALSDDGCFDEENFNNAIRNTLAFSINKPSGSIENDKNTDGQQMLPAGKFIELLEKYGLIEPLDGNTKKYERSRLGKDLASYALALDTVDIITSTCSAIVSALKKLVGVDTSSEITKRNILDFVEQHYLDILYRLSRSSELVNIFTQNRDEAVFTENALRYLKNHKSLLLDDWALFKIVEDTYTKGCPLPNPNKSFAIKRAISIFEWMKGKTISDIKEETGLTYIRIGDLDRLGDVCAYLWEAMIKALSGYGGSFSSLKTRLTRLSGRMKYGVEADLVILASRHIPYVTRVQLANLKIEATSKNLSPEEYVRDYQFRSTQKALTDHQFVQLIDEFKEHYRIDDLDNVPVTINLLKKYDLIDDDAQKTLEEIFDKKALSIKSLYNLFTKGYHAVSVDKKKNYVEFRYSKYTMNLYIINCERKVGKDIFIAKEKELCFDSKNNQSTTRVFLSKEGFESDELTGVKKENDTFLSFTSFSRLFRTSLQSSSGLIPFAKALFAGYTFIAESEVELYLKNFLSDETDDITSDTVLSKTVQQTVTMYIAYDRVKCQRIVSSFIDELKERFQSGLFIPRYMTWGESGYSFGKKILTSTSNVFLFVDEDFMNQKIIPQLTQDLTAKIHDTDDNMGRVLVLFLNHKAEISFLENYPQFHNCQTVNLENTDYKAAAEYAYESLIKQIEGAK